MKMRTFVEVTQRGYAYGLCNEKGVRYCERYAPCGSDNASIDRAYREASSGASALLSTYKRARRLIRDLGPMPGILEAYQD